MVNTVDLEKLLKKACGLDLTQKVLLGFSGGPDSLYLLDHLIKMGIPVVAAHLNHNLRPESDREAEEATRLAENFGIPIHLSREDVSRYAQEHTLSLEEAARIVRYRFLFTEAERCGAQAVAVAHTADDQVETVMMHLLRGSGLAGLRGMAFRSLPNPWSRQIPLIRPMLRTWRVDIMTYLEANDLSPIYDLSNQDVRFYRNYLRHELIPYLEMKHPHLKERLWQTADILKDDFDVLEKLIDDAWPSCLHDRGKGYLLINRKFFLDQPESIQRGLARRAILSLRPGLVDIDYQTTLLMLEFIRAPSRSGSCDLAAGLRLFLELDHIGITTWEAELPAGASSNQSWPSIENDLDNLTVPGEVEIKNGWRIKATRYSGKDAVTAREEAKLNADPFTAWLDADLPDFTLAVRARMPGDRFHPLGMDSKSLKISDFMINVKLPRRARKEWPLVLSGSSIIWVPGFQIAHPFMITPTTHDVIQLTLRRGMSDITKDRLF